MAAAPLLVIGKAGQLATALRAVDARMICLGRGEIDIMSADDVRRALEAHAPAAVINAAAYTAVDRAESEQGEALALNAVAPGIIAAACVERATPFVHVSTDFVFGGETGAPYAEDHPTDPVNFYGESKARGERAVQAQGGRAAIIRTSWVFSETGRNFVKTMLRRASEQDEIAVVADQVGRPTSARSLAGACVAVADAMTADAAAAGLYHVANRGEASWFELAEAVMAEARRRGWRAAHIKAIATAEYPTAAKRPRDSRLATGRIEALLGREIQHWREALGEVCTRLASAGGPVGD